MAKRSSLFLMANLATEVDRIFRSKESGNLKMALGAHDRAKKIIKNIIQCEEMKSRAQEIDILDDVVDDLVGSSPKYNISKQTIKDYFMPFILRMMGPR